MKANNLLKIINRRKDDIDYESECTCADCTEMYEALLELEKIKTNSKLNTDIEEIKAWYVKQDNVFSIDWDKNEFVLSAPQGMGCDLWHGATVKDVVENALKDIRTWDLQKEEASDE